MMYRLVCSQTFWLLLWIAIAQTGMAQEVVFTLKAPNVVSVGERFRLTYTLNTQQGTQFQPGNVEGFSILSGPSTSSSTSVQIVNGRMKQSVELSYTYILQAQKEGKFTLGGGEVKVEGKSYTSNTVDIEVVKGNTNRSAAPNSGNRPNASGNMPNVNREDLFLRMYVSKDKVRRGEPVVATLKLYTRVSLSNLGAFKAPGFNGFWSESLRDIQQLDLQRESYNGQVYNAAILGQYVLIPEKTGELTIDPAEITAYVQVRLQQSRRSRSLFDDFFGRTETIEEVLKTPAVKVRVDPLPSGAPIGYTGAVGDIKMSVEVDPLEAKTNEPISLKIKYAGTGNLKLLATPDIKFPADFETYDPKVNDRYKASGKGFSGSKQLEYLIIPRHEGDYEIPAIQFSVFDLTTNQYKTYTEGPFQIKVEKGENSDNLTVIGSDVLKEEVKNLGSDIRYIKTGAIQLRTKDNSFFGSLAFYLSYLLGIVVFALLLFLVRWQRKRNSDEVVVKNKKAGKLAQSRLKTAKSYMDKGHSGPFYKEMLNALWGYLSDKLNIPQGELSKEKIKQALTAKNVPESLIQQLTSLMDRCEFAQFAPGSVEGGLTKDYEAGGQLIEQLNKAFK